MERWRLSAGAVGAAILVLAGCGGGDGGGGDAAAGKQVFVEKGCGNCHTLAAVGAKRNVAPNLDQSLPGDDEEHVRESITDPSAKLELRPDGEPYRDIMPAYGPDEELPDNQLTDAQLDDLVAFLLAEGAKGR